MIQAVEATAGKKETPVEVTRVSVAKGGCEQYRHIFERYDWDVKVAMAIMQAESGCDPGGKGDDFPINGVHRVSCGLMQVRTLEGRPTCEQLKNPETNILWAYKLYKSPNSWKHWTMYNNGRYLKHM